MSRGRSPTGASFAGFPTVDKRALYTHEVGTTSLDNNDPLKVYLHELAAILPLSSDEEADLSQHVRTQDEQAESAGTLLIEANLSLVVSIAERHSSAGIQILDLIQKGNEGLLLALESFIGSSSSFSTHAAICIEDAVLKAIAESQAPSEKRGSRDSSVIQPWLVTAACQSLLVPGVDNA
jgi:DNA-directed RNA polymerase sigma subunit (sigma70/sigma32)